MRHIHLLFLAFPILFSCGDQDSTVSERHFSYKIDTVKVESHELLLNVQGGLNRMAISPDGQTLYFYNTSEKRLDLIDLNSYQISRSIFFTADGPQGIGGISPYGFEITERGEIIIASFDAIRKMDLLGNKIESYNWESLNYQSGQIPEGTILSFDGEYDPTGNIFYGVYGRERGGNSNGDGLGILDIPNRAIRTKEIPLLKSLTDYKIELDGDVKTIGFESFFLQHENEKILISTEAHNSLAVYDICRDSLYQIDFSSELLPDKKPGNFEKKVTSLDQMKASLLAKAKEVSFGPWIWDESSQHYFRISQYQSGFDPPEFQVYVTVADPDFQVVLEQKDFPRARSNAFFHQGYLHHPINLNDELYFVRIKPEFQF